MGVGFLLYGAVTVDESSQDQWFQSTADWFVQQTGEALESLRSGDNFEGIPTLFLSLHPTAEELEISIVSPGRISATAKTSTVGAGYHQYLCDLMKKFGEECGVEWEPPPDDGGTGDETGYFESGDFGAIEYEMQRWLLGTANRVREVLGDDYTDLMISMPLGHTYPNQGPLSTNLGPRDLAWLDRVIADPASGLDLFAWPEPGFGASYYRGRALCRMWTDVRWRSPLIDSERQTLMTVHHDLKRAYELDAALELPWREWNEVMEYLAADANSEEAIDDELKEEVARRAGSAHSTPLIGYRRMPIRVQFNDSWSISIPGEMAEDWTEEGNWHAWDGWTTVWFNSLSIEKKDGSKPSAEELLNSFKPDEGEEIRFEGERPVGSAAIRCCVEDDEESWQLSGRLAVAGSVAIVNIYFANEDDRESVIAIWNSIDHPVDE